MIKVIPAHGLTVRDPDSNVALPPEGAEVPESEYWARRLMDGDVRLVKKPAVSAAKNKKSS